MIKPIRIIGSHSLLGVSVYLLLLVVVVISSGGVVDPGNPPQVYQNGHFIINKGSHIFVLLAAILSFASIFLMWPYRHTKKVYLISHYIFAGYTTATLVVGCVFYMLSNYFGATYA